MTTDFSSKRTPQAFWFGRLFCSDRLQGARGAPVAFPLSWSPPGAGGTCGSHRCPTPPGSQVGWGSPRSLEEVLAVQSGRLPVGGASAGLARMPGQWTSRIKDEDFAKDAKIEIWDVVQGKVRDDGGRGQGETLLRRAVPPHAPST